MPLRFFTLVCAVIFLTTASARAELWQQVDTAVAKEPPECVSWSETRVDCFSRSFGGSLSWVFADNGKWSAPRNLGGTLTAVPSCIVRGPGGINCFATTARGVLATISLNGENWGKWTSLGGALIPSRVACLTPGRDHIVCFGRGSQGQLLQREWSGGRIWEAWRDLGGNLTADPECIVVGASSAACFGRGSKGDLVAFLPASDGRSGGWTSLGGKIEGKPSCVRLKSGDVACAAPGANASLQLWRGTALFAQPAGSLASLEGQVSGEPACTLQAGELVCFWRNQRQQLVRHAFAPGGQDNVVPVETENRNAAVSCLPLSADRIGCMVADTGRHLRFAFFGPAQVQEVAKTDAAASVDAGVSRDNSEAQGIWYLTNLSSGAHCRVVLEAAPKKTLQPLAMSRTCRSLGVPDTIARWELGRGGVHLSGSGRKARMHFTAAGTGKWISSKGEAAFSLTRQAPERTAGARLTPASSRTTAGAPISGTWRIIDGQKKTLCSLELSTRQTLSGYAVNRDPACTGLYDNVQYWTESGTGLVLVGSGNVVVARFVAAGEHKWRTQSAGGVSLVR